MSDRTPAHVSHHSRTLGLGPNTRFIALRPPRRMILAALSTAGVLLLASCSGSAEPAGETTTAAAGGFPAESLQTIADYTGSTLGAADPDLEPVTWGFVNQEGGGLSFPQYTVFAEELVDIVNSELGGIGGRPLELDICHVVSSDEEGQACGQQFASNDAISAVLQYPLINGNASFHRVIDATGIPVVGSTANGPNDAAAPSSFYMSGPDLSTVPILSGYVIDELDADSVAIVGIEGNPISQLISGQMKSTFEAAGLEARLAAVPQTSTDATAPLLAAGVQDADAIVALLNGASLCSSVATALQTLGATDTPVVTVSGCSDRAVAETLGDFPQWTFLDGYPSTLAPALDEREEAERAVARALWESTRSLDGYLMYAAPTAQTFLTALALVNSAGGADATRESTIAAAADFTGPLFLGPETVGWGTIAPAPTVANLAQRLYTYQGDDEWVDAVDGWYAPAR